MAHSLGYDVLSTKSSDPNYKGVAFGNPQSVADDTLWPPLFLHDHHGCHWKGPNEQHESFLGFEQGTEKQNKRKPTEGKKLVFY
jgi:hypothetical protein